MEEWLPGIIPPDAPERLSEIVERIEISGIKLNPDDIVWLKQMVSLLEIRRTRYQRHAEAIHRMIYSLT